MPTSRRRFFGAAAAAVVSGALAVVGLAAPAAEAAPSSDIIYTVRPISIQYSQGAQASFPTPSQCLAQYGLMCYTPAEIRKAYNIPDGWTGAGRSIAIVDAYGSPTIEQDLATFNQAFGLPAADLHIYYPNGRPESLTAHKGQPLAWAGETTLDVEWAHAVAPEARINLIVAPNNYGNALNVAVRYAVDNNLGDVLSMSYGAPESAIAGQGNNLQLKQSHDNFAAATAKGISLFASAGDFGATDGGKVISAGYPASDPLVTSIGGTNLYTQDDGAYVHETTWGDQADCPLGCKYGPIGATGGAPSVVFPAPSYQQGVTGNPMRTTSDVSYNASVYTAVLVYASFDPTPGSAGFYFYGGTSSGAPQWAAITALADQQAGKRLGALNPALYSLAGTPAATSALHDVTEGSNAWDGPGYSAGVGYDLPTGLGTPDVTRLVEALLA